MKKTIKLAVVAALALGTTSAFATNGSALIGMGAKARGMGGTSIGIAHGAESAIANGALITSVENTEISFGGTLFMPDVSNSTPAGAASSDADMSVIPEVSIAAKITDNFYAGIGMWGTAGMGVDYRDDATQYNMVTNLQLMQFGVPLAYKMDNLSLAVTPVLQYGALDVNYDMDGNPVNGVQGMGVAQDLAFGVNLGVAYEISGVTIGALYKSQIDMEYKGFSHTVDAFVGGLGNYTNNELSTPAEMGIGASYVMNEHTIAIDYKQIAWSDAKGYEDFMWDDQDVVSIGYEYAVDGWAARVGYSYAESPISEQDATSPSTGPGSLPGAVINTFNLLGFPGIVESHITVGGSYNLNKQTSVDLALAYAPEVSESYDVTGGGVMMTTDHSQTSVSFGVNFKY